MYSLGHEINRYAHYTVFSDWLYQRNLHDSEMEKISVNNMAALKGVNHAHVHRHFYYFHILD